MLIRGCQVDIKIVKLVTSKKGKTSYSQVNNLRNISSELIDCKIRGHEFNVRRYTPYAQIDQPHRLNLANKGMAEFEFLISP